HVTHISCSAILEAVREWRQTPLVRFSGNFACSGNDGASLSVIWPSPYLRTKKSEGPFVFCAHVNLPPLCICLDPRRKVVFTCQGRGFLCREREAKVDAFVPSEFSQSGQSASKKQITDDVNEVLFCCRFLCSFASPLNQPLNQMNTIFPPTGAPAARLLPEVWAEIVRLIDPNQLAKLTQVERAPRDLALSEIWKIAEHPEHVVYLFIYPPEQRQQFVDRMRELHVWIIDEHDFTGLRFPHLNRLHVIEKGVQPETSNVANIDGFIQPELVLLNLLVGQGHGLVSNILPLLATQTPCLKELNIGIKIENATSAQLLRALQACPLLEIFKVAGESGSLVDPAVFAHLALVARLSEFELGAEIGHLLLEPTIASLPAHRTIFDHLATAYLNVNPSAAKLLFPRVKATEAMSLRISEPSDILTWVAEMPRLVTLELQCMRSMPLNRHVLAGLQNMDLQRFKINAGAGAAIDGSEIQADQLDYLFSNHLTLSELTFAWQGSSSSAHIMSFLQYSPHLVLEKIARFYPNVRELTLVAPCAAIDFLRTPDIPLNMNLRFLTIERIAQPAQPPQNTNYNRDVRIIAEKIDYHFPNLSVLESVNDKAFTAFVFRDVRRIKKMRRDMARLGGEYLYMFPRYVLYR
ncbi:hypothetical protein D6D06_10432, partial [Aureobasidium pullulans]